MVDDIIAQSSKHLHLNQRTRRRGQQSTAQGSNKQFLQRVHTSRSPSEHLFHRSITHEVIVCSTATRRSTILTTVTHTTHIRHTTHTTHTTPQTPTNHFQHAPNPHPQKRAHRAHHRRKSRRHHPFNRIFRPRQRLQPSSHTHNARLRPRYNNTRCIVGPSRSATRRPSRRTNRFSRNDRRKRQIHTGGAASRCRSNGDVHNDGDTASTATAAVQSSSAFRLHVGGEVDGDGYDG